jgi:hypothetical protein
MTKYSKSIAAAVGLIALLSEELLGLKIEDETIKSVTQGILAIGTWVAVYGIPNKS